MYKISLLILSVITLLVACNQRASDPHLGKIISQIGGPVKMKTVKSGLFELTLPDFMEEERDLNSVHTQVYVSQIHQIFVQVKDYDKTEIAQAFTTNPALLKFGGKDLVHSFAHLAFQPIRDSVSSIISEDIQNLNLNGLKGVSYNLEANGKKEGIFYCIYALEGNKRLYRVLAFTPRVNKSENGAIMKQIIESFKEI